MQDDTMEATLRQWTVEVLEAHRPLLTLAVRQRAKLGGWLKFELAVRAEQAGYGPVFVEAGYGEYRADIALHRGPDRYDVELKTPNTNWRIPGVEAKQRPVTKNIAGVVADARKLASTPGRGIVCFVHFPVPTGDGRWAAYVARIARELDVPLSEAEHCARLDVPLGEGWTCEVVVGAFPFPAEARSDTSVTAREPVCINELV